jgi:tetratricopeptide (TPR) repeat protein
MPSPATRPLVLVGLLSGLGLVAASWAGPAPVDPLWQSEAFRRAFTGSYGTDGRIEPTITAEERAVLETVAAKMRAGDRDGAVAALTGSSLLERSAALLFSLGNLRFEQGDAAGAVQRLEQAVALYPSFRDARRNLAVALVRENRVEDARPHLVRALELGAQDGLTLGLLGYVHAGAGRHQAALQAYRLAQLTMPEEAQWKLGEAEALLALDDPQATVSIYGELLASRPENALYWLGQADAWHRLGKPWHAIANLEFVRRLGKLDAAQTIGLGHLYLNEGAVASAVASYRAGVEATPPPPFAKAVDAVEALCGHREWTAAREIADALPVPDPSGSGTAAADGARLDRCLALIELETGDAAEGERRVKALVAADPTDGLALVLLARYRAREGKTEEAVQLFEQAARDPEAEDEALRRHAQLEVERGDYGTAAKLLGQALALRPDPGLEAYLDSVRRLAE